MSELNEDIGEEDRNRVVDVCHQYLGSVWKSNDIIIKRFSQGYFNKIYYCELKSKTNGLNECHKRAVVVKLSREKEFFLYKPLDSIINTLVISGERLSPKVLGVFPGGLITEYISSRTYDYKDDDNPIIVKLLAQKLAQFHNIKSPVPIDGTDRWIAKIFDNFFNTGYKSVRNTIIHSSYESLKRLDIAKQLLWLKDAVMSADKALVFSHCDFNRGNILVKQLDQCFHIFFIDFDFASNNFRGIDFGRFFSSWKQVDPIFGYGDYPTDDEMRIFIDAYIQEWDRLTDSEFSKCELNSRQHLINEAKLFTLVGVLIDVWFCLLKAGMDQTMTDDFLAKGDRRYGFYLHLKQLFQKQNALPKGFN